MKMYQISVHSSELISAYREEGEKKKITKNYNKKAKPTSTLQLPFKIQYSGGLFRSQTR